MKYGKTLIVLGIVNVLVIFSGIPTTWKKVVIIVTTLLIVGIGWILNTVAKKRKERAIKQAHILERESEREINEIADVIVADMKEQVDKEIGRI